jgi:hypothetical protein
MQAFCMNMHQRIPSTVRVFDTSDTYWAPIISPATTGLGVSIDMIYIGLLRLTSY